MHKLVKRMHCIEDMLLVALLSSMIGLATLQILLRISFDYGLIWADPILRVLVLWLGMVGAMVASRHNKHIHIDLITRYFSKTAYLLLQAFIGQFTAWICLIIAWHGARWVQMDYVDALTSIAGLPAWILEIIIPVSFAVIGLRYFIASIRWGSVYLRRMRRQARFSK